MKQELMQTAFQLLINHSADMVFIKDKNLVYQAASDAFVKMVGKTSAEEIIGHTDDEVFVDQNLARRYQQDDRKLLATGKDLLHFIEPITDEDGHPRYGATSKYLLRDSTDNVIGILGITEDVTIEYLARQHYQQELRYLFALPEDTYAVSYIDVDDWRVIKQRHQQIENGTLQECQTVEELCGYAIQSIVSPDAEAVTFYREFTPEKLRSIYSSGKDYLEFEYERKLSDGSTRWVHNEVHFLMDTDSGHLCIMLSAKDIHSEKQEEERIQKAATLDLMTQVLNRETAMDAIRQILTSESHNSHVLFMLDIDNFKSLNDTLGHQAGDEFLIKLARELKYTIRDNDIIGRIGGDEFFIFLRNLSEPNHIERKAQEIVDTISKVTTNYSSVKLSGSVGVSLYPKDGTTLETLYSKADVALYKAKRAGKNQYQFSNK